MPARLPLLCLALILAACASRATLPNSATRCTEPRPQLCTMQYLPVCASTVDASAPGTTYANACAACADPAVAWHRPGTCPP